MSGLTDEQRAERADAIGASEIAAICGLSPFQTAMDVWMKKTGKAAPEDSAPTDAMHFGTVLEGVIADEFARRTGKKVRRWSQGHRKGRLVAHLDRIIEGERSLLECKTAGMYVDWPDNDGLPDYYRVQVEQQMHCSGRPEYHLAVLQGGNSFHMFHGEQSGDLTRSIVEAGEHFWSEHVEKDVPPPPTSAGDIEKTLRGRDVGGKLALDESLVEVVRGLAGARQAEKEAKERANALKLEVQKAMMEHGEVVDGEGMAVVTWKPSEEREKWDYQSLAEDYASRLAALVEEGEFKALLDRMREKHMKMVAGPRRFLVKPRAAEL